MAVKVVTGPPRAGKSYYCVWHLVDKYFDFEKNRFEWNPKKDDKGRTFTIFTNLKDFKLPHVDLHQYFDDKGWYDTKTCTYNVSEFFTIPYQDKVYEKYGPVIYIIDEAHEWFPASMRSDMVCNFFRKHGQYGQDFYLITQYWPAVHNFITGLTEFEIKTVPQTLSVAGEFRYQYLCKGEKIGNKVLKRDPKISALYTSHKSKEIEKRPAPLKKLALLVAVLLVGIVLALKMFFSTFYPSPQDLQEKGGGVAGARAAGPAAPAPPPPGSSSSDKVIDAAPRPGRLSDISTGRVVAIDAGALWIGRQPAVIHVLGRTYRPSEMPYLYLVESDPLRVKVIVPESDFSEFLAARAVEASMVKARAGDPREEREDS